MIINETHLSNINSSVRKIQGKAELYKDSALTHSFRYTDRLKSFSIERVGESKFFGFGVCQKLNLKLVDKDRELEITTDNSIVLSFGCDSNYITTTPTFYVTEVHRDENTNELSITAYDAIYKATKYTFNDLELVAPYTIYDVAIGCRKILGLNGCGYTADDVWNLSYEEGANFEGTETIREVMDAIAEATQTVYYVNSKQNLFFKRLDKAEGVALTIDKSKYISLDSKTNRRLATICHATELGDNVSASITESGTTQYVRDNPFWELREDIDTLVDNALSAIGGLTINQFNCEWRGNYLLEIGDKVALTTKDNSNVISFLLNDTLTYDGGLSQSSEWSYEDNDEETADNPTSLGDVLKQTYARVDKANKQIDIVASDIEANSEAIAALGINTESITASVSNMETSMEEKFEAVNGELETLSTQVSASMTAEDVKIEIQSELSNGVSKVATSTGYTFDDSGLSIEKTGSEMKTQITEDGMTVYRNDEEVLVANNVGVEATNLHATTYLIIGTNSRFEDYGNRTGCFWIG